MEEGVKVRSLTCNTSKVRGAHWNSRMGTRTNSQVKVQDEINLYNQEKKIVSANQMEVMWWI